MLNVVFVGNGTMQTDYSDVVNSADMVIRSQGCVNYGVFAGTKTDVLCVRPSNEPFGEGMARNKDVHAYAAQDCRYVISAHRSPHPSYELLFEGYPYLRHHPMCLINEEPTRQLLLRRGATVSRDDGQLNPTMGMCLLHSFMEHQLYFSVDLTCVGFAWRYGWDDHDQNIERKIQLEWAEQGHMRFLT